MTLALPAGEGAGLVATVLPLGRGERRNVCGAFAAMAAIFVQDPVVVPPFPGEAFAKLYGLTGGELRVLLGDGAWAWRQGGGGGARHQRGDGKNARAAHLRQNRHLQADRAHAPVHERYSAGQGGVRVGPML